MKRWIVTLMMIVCLAIPGQSKVVDAATETLRILATSDIHNRFVGYDYATNAPTKGGFSRVATLIEQNKTPNTVLLDNGDTIQGNNAILFNKDAVQPMVKGLNLMQYDTYTTGNHEYNYGMDYVERLKQSFQGAFLTANVYKGEPIAANRIAKNYTIIERNGIKTAVIGVVTPHIMRWDAANLAGYTVTNPYDEVKSAVQEIKANHLSDVIVVSFHASIDGEYGNDSAKELANLVPEVDVIIAGHAHETRIERSQNNSIVIEPGSSGSHLAMVDITLTKTDTGYTANRQTDMKAINLVADNKVSELPLITTNLDAEHKRAVADASTQIGKLVDGNLLPDNVIAQIPQSQLADNALIDLVLHTQLDEAKKGVGITPNNVHHVSSAAIFNTSTNVLAGDLTKADVAKIYQFDNTLETIQITGSMLKQFMEANTAYYNQYHPGDLTVSFNETIRAYNYDMFEGVDYTIDIAKPVGQRLGNLKYSDSKRPVEDQDVIYLTVNNYRASGLRNTFTTFKQAPKVYESVGQPVDLIRDMIKNRIIKEQIIRPVYSGNWQLLHPQFDTIDRQIIEKLVREKKLDIPKSQDGRTPNVASITSADIASHKQTVLATTDDFTQVDHNNTTPFGSLVTGMMKHSRKADAAMIPKTIIQQPWKKGNVTYNDIYTGVSFQQSIGVYTVRQEQLTKIISDHATRDMLNLEYSGFIVDMQIENEVITVSQLKQKDGTPLPETLKIALPTALAQRYQLTSEEDETIDLQDVLIGEIELLDHLANTYEPSYYVHTLPQVKQSEVNQVVDVQSKETQQGEELLPDTGRSNSGGSRLDVIVLCTIPALYVCYHDMK